MKFAVLLAAVLLCCQSVQTQARIQPLHTTPQTPELAEVRASLNVAYLKDRETTTVADCDSPRVEDISPPQNLEVEACRLSIGSSADYRIKTPFSDGLSWIADPDGIRQAGAEALKLLN